MLRRSRRQVSRIPQVGLMMQLLVAEGTFEIHEPGKEGLVKEELTKHYRVLTSFQVGLTSEPVSCTTSPNQFQDHFPPGLFHHDML